MRSVRCVCVAGRDEGVVRAVAEGLCRWWPETAEGKRNEPLLLLQTVPGPRSLCDARPELLVWADRVEETEGEPLRCRCALLPGEAAGGAARLIAPDCAVSYGMSPRDSLTLSSTAGGQIMLALQRELITLDGRILERQEFPLRAWTRASPRTLLPAAGALLLLGVRPEALMQ